MAIINNPSACGIPAPINEIIDTGCLPFISLGISADLEVMDRLEEREEHIGDEMHRVEQLFTRDVELERVGQPVAIDDITTPVEGLAEAMPDCGICLSKVTPPAALIKPCKHAYCKECLETWTYACQINSHPYLPNSTLRKAEVQAGELRTGLQLPPTN